MDKVAVAKITPNLVIFKNGQSGSGKKWQLRKVAKSTKIWHFLLSHFLPCPFLPLKLFHFNPCFKSGNSGWWQNWTAPTPPNNNDIDSDQILMSCVHYWHIVYLYFADLRIVNGPL